MKKIELDSQNTVANNICEILEELGKSTENSLAVVNLFGEEGSGKSAIVELITQKLSVGWGITEIMGTDTDTLPSAAIKAKKRAECYLLPSVSIKRDIATFGINLRFQEADSIFNDIQKKFIKNTIKGSGPKLIIVENFHKLDEVSRKFVKTLWSKDLFNSNFKKVFRKSVKNPIIFLITSNARLENAAQPFEVKKIDTTELQTLAKDCYRLELDDNKAKQIQHITSGNIKFIRCILNWQGVLSEQSLRDLIDKRIDEISHIYTIPDKQSIEELCTYGAYFEHGFTVDYLVKLSDRLTQKNIFDVFSHLQNIGFIEEERGYKHYTAEGLKNAFVSHEINCRQLYFSSMYKFYSRYYDFQYETRLKFLYNLYLQERGDANVDKIVALMFLDTCNKIYNRSIQNQNEIKDYLQRYEEIDMPDQLLNILLGLADNSLQYEQIQSELSQQYDILILAELHRLALNLISKTSQSTNLIDHLIRQSIKIRKNLANSEFLGVKHPEQYECFVLQDAIITQLINRSSLSSIFDEQKECYENYLENLKNVDKTIYSEQFNHHKRKSCLYECCDYAMRYLADAEDYYLEVNNIYELQKVYVNQLGLYCVTSRTGTSKCKKLYKTLVDFMAAQKDTQFADIYKYHHNLLLYKFICETQKCHNDDEYKKIAQSICKEYTKLNNKYHKNLLRLNMVSLTCIFDIQKAKSSVDDFLKDLGKERNFDSFYYYHLVNFQIMFCIIDRDWDNALRLLLELQKITFPIFNDAQENYNRRLIALQWIIKNKVTRNSMLEYDRIIYDVLHSGINPEYFEGKDESWQFYAKSFLLTDAQYFD